MKITLNPKTYLMMVMVHLLVAKSLKPQIQEFPFTN